MNSHSFIEGRNDDIEPKRPKYMQIIDAAVEVIAENGYHQSQVSKIAKQAGVADGTIYLYFKTKRIYSFLLKKRWASSLNAWKKK